MENLILRRPVASTNTTPPPVIPVAGSKGKVPLYPPAVSKFLTPQIADKRTINMTFYENKYGFLFQELTGWFSGIEGDLTEA